MLQILAGAAALGERCPTNNEIAAALNLSSVSGPVKIVHNLEADGLIKVDRFAAGRIVTIVATGQSTAKPSHTTQHWSAGQ